MNKILIVLSVFVSNLVFAQSFTRDDKKAVVDQFFANYQLLEQGFDQFAAEQAKLLSPDIYTYNRYNSSEYVYRGIEGFSESIQEWSSKFKTSGSFRYRFYAEEPRQISVRIRTNLAFAGNDYGGTDHCWIERFSFDDDLKISRLDVMMNLGRDCKEIDDVSGLSLLARAAALGDMEQIRYLHERRKVRLDLLNHDGASALYFAAQNTRNPVEVYRYFKEHLSKEAFEALLTATVIPNSHTVAFEAVFNVNTDLVRYLLELKEDDYVVDFATASVFAWTPKTFAEREDMPFAADLPEGEVVVEDRQLWLQRAEQSWLERLDEQQGAYHERGLELIAAVRNSELALVRQLISEQNIDVNGHYGRLGATPLNSAVIPGMSAEDIRKANEAIAVLIDLGADPNNAETGIMKVPHGFREAVFGYPDILESVIEYFRSQRPSDLYDYLDAQGPMNGYTKLIDAALRGRTAVIELLLESGAHKGIAGYNGMTAYKAALLYNSTAEEPIPAAVMEKLR